MKDLQKISEFDIIKTRRVIMLDIKQIRENPEKIEAQLRKRQPTIDLKPLVEYDKNKRELIQKVEILKNQKNIVSSEIATIKQNKGDAQAKVAEMKQVGIDIAKLDKEIAVLSQQINDIMFALPNIPSDDVVAGGKENNIVLEYYNEKPTFDFEIANHVEICENKGLVDYARGVKLAGAGNWIYKNKGALLEWSLLNYFIKEHVADNYEFLLVPHMLHYECGFVAGQFPKFEKEVYWIDGEQSQKDSFMLPTAESALANYHRNETFLEKDLPKKYFSYTPCFRREAGSTRVEERGTIRGHQFNKVEMFQYVSEDKSEEAFEELLTKAQNLVKKLGLHYRTVKLAAEDCSASMGKTYDIEVWIPSMNDYKEVSSVSNAYSYQARRGNIKYRTEEGDTRFVHTLNASGLATSRLIPAIVEQFQTKDGHVNIPEVLWSSMGVKLI